MQNHRAGVSGSLIHAQQHLASHHHTCYLCLVSFFCNQFTSILAPAQYRNSIGEFEHFTQLMCDEDDGLALRDKATQDAKELKRLLWRQYAGRFIHDEDVGAT